MRGMEDEFRDVFVARAPALRRTAFLLCGDWHQAEDLVQTAFAKLYASWRRAERPEAYVHRVLVRAFVDETRRPWRRERSYADLPETPVSDAVDDREVLRAALRQVPPRQRACLVLRYFEDLSVTETARVLGCTEGNVKSQTSRGLDALRVLVPDREALL